MIARSNEAKALGIEMAAPWHLIEQKFGKQGVVVRSSNYTLYGDMSRRVMRILSNLTPNLEIYSIESASAQQRTAPGAEHSAAPWARPPRVSGRSPLL